MADLRRFANRVREVGVRVQDNADAMTREVALAVDAAVVMATPVDTGRARSNWQVALGAAPTGTRAPYSPGEEGSTSGTNTQAAIEQGRQAISGYRGGQVIHITNNLSYIGRLNAGHSAQAPSGFVERAVLAGVAAVQATGSLLQRPPSGEL